MSEFDITFELFTLLLGLAMAEVLAGYARVYKMRSRLRHARPLPADGALVDTRVDTGAETGGEAGGAAIRVGWLIPMTAAVVICHQATFWLFMYQMQASVPLNFLSLLFVLGVIGWYYLISSALWPDEPGAWPDFDAYYLAHRRFIWWGVI